MQKIIGRVGALLLALTFLLGGLTLPATAEDGSALAVPTQLTSQKKSSDRYTYQYDWASQTMTITRKGEPKGSKLYPFLVSSDRNTQNLILVDSTAETAIGFHPLVQKGLIRTLKEVSSSTKRQHWLEDGETKWSTIKTTSTDTYRYTKDKKGRLVRVDVDSHGERFDYDDDDKGKLSISRSSDLSAVTTYEYDAQNRVSKITRKTHSRGREEGTTYTFVFRYDGAGNMTEIRKEKRSDFGAGETVCDTDFPDGRLTESEIGESLYTYDTEGRLTTSEEMPTFSLSPKPMVETFSYNEDGTVKSVRMSLNLELIKEALQASAEKNKKEFDEKSFEKLKEQAEKQSDTFLIRYTRISAKEAAK